MDRTPSKTLAALWMAGWLTLMLIIAIAGREAAREINVFQLMEMRSVLGFLMLYPLIRARGGFVMMKTARLPQHVARNLIHYGAQLGWFFALTLIPIGQVVAIEFTMPIWTAILAATFLGERMTPWKIAAIVLGIVGVFVIVRPAASEINPGQLIALAAAVVAHPDRADTLDPILDAGDTVGGRSPPRALRLDVAASPSLGLGGGNRVLRHVFPLLHGARDAARGCHRGDPDGFSARSFKRRRRLADLFGTAGCIHRARRGADPHWQSVEPETESFAACARARLKFISRAVI
jgi:uncharacterized membrane protein